MRDRRGVGDHLSGVAPGAGHAAAFVPPLPAGRPLAQGVDDADHLMPRHARILHDREETLHRNHIAVANAASLDAKAHFLGTRDGNVPLFRDEPPTPLPDDHCAHLRHYRISFGRDETIEPIGQADLRIIRRPAPPRNENSPRSRSALDYGTKLLCRGPVKWYRFPLSSWRTPADPPFGSSVSSLESVAVRNFHPCGSLRISPRDLSLSIVRSGISLYETITQAWP